MTMNAIISRATVALGCLLVSGPSASAQGVHQADTDRVPFAAKAQRAGDTTTLGLHRTAAFRTGPFTRTLDAVRAEDVAEADRAAEQRFASQRPAPTRVGLVRSLGANSPRLKEPDALKSRQPDGTDAWLLAIQSPGATGLRLHLKGLDAGSGTVIVYAETAQGVITRGPFTARGPNGEGEVWTPWLPGDLVYVQVSGTAVPALEVAEVLHFDKDIAGMREGGAGGATCLEDVACFNVDEGVRDAVVRMNFVVNGGGFFCTGTILNDLDGETYVPYFLTAFHCLNTQPIVDTLETVFFWQRSGCFGTQPDYATLPRLTGGTLLAANSGNDMTFIRLNGDLPNGAGLAGWTVADPGAGSFGIHHPGGDFKRIHWMHVNNNFNACVPSGQYHYFELERGNFLGGSSGSAAFDANGRVVGQLLGFCPLGADQCGNYPNWRAVYGKFSVTYPLIQSWLQVGGTIHVNRFYAGTEVGTQGQPFRTVNAANNFAWNGARMKISAGNYNEAVTFNKRMVVLANGGPVIIGRP